MQIPGTIFADPTHTSSNTSDLPEPDRGTVSEPACPICGGTGFVYPNVSLDDARYGTAAACRCQQQDDAAQRPRLQRYSNLGPLLRLTFDNLVPQGIRSGNAEHQARYRRAVEAGRAWADEPEGWLALFGPSGCGKTHLAAAIAGACLENGQPCFFLSVPDLLDHLRSTFAPQSAVTLDDLFEQVRTAPVLVLDDLGAQSSTPWAQEKLFQLLNYRYSVPLPTVITSSLTLEMTEERIRTRMEDPAVSRICVLEEPAGALRQYQEILELPHLRDMTFQKFVQVREGLDPEQRANLLRAYQTAVGFAQHPGGWLVLQGKNGCGKTHLAAAIGHFRREAGQPVFFLVVADLLDHLRSTFAPDSTLAYDTLFEQVRTAPLLILDDFGTHTSSPWAWEKLFQILNYRYNARLATVITTDLRIDDQLEDRFRSRMMDMRVSTVFGISAPGYILTEQTPKDVPRGPGGDARGRNTTGRSGRPARQ